MEKTLVQDIEVSKELNHSIEKVWQAISQADLISKWFIKADFKAEVGYKYTFTHENTVINGTIKEVQEPTKLVYTWMIVGTNAESTVTWQLAKINKGTKVTIIHSNIDSHGDSAIEMMKQFKAGWQNCLQDLGAFLS